MSATETPRETLTLVREFTLPAESWDGRTLDVRVVPYNTATTVADPPRFEPYEEMFLPGAFQRQLTTPGRDRVYLNFEHEAGLRGVVGQSLRFQERDDGLHGSFGVHENADGDKALEMIRSGFLSGLSMEFRPVKGGTRVVNGIVQRVRANLDRVSLCRYPAYSAAQVLALREEPDEPEELETQPCPPPPSPPPPPVLVPRSAATDALLAELGYAPLERAGTTANAWDGSPARFTDEQYARSTLFCRPGDAPVKERCSLPVLEPDGTLNVNALGAAAGVLAGARGGVGNVSVTLKAAAARKLLRYYKQAGMQAPASLVQLAGSA